MIVVPKEKPFLENLNSYYVDVRKLFEHFQGEIGYGGVYFKSASAEGIIFFDKDNLLNGIFQDKADLVEGKEAVDRLLELVERNNFSINVYNIGAERVHLWSNLSNATEVYKDLSTEFTDLEGLMKKMKAENLTGFIDVAIGDGKEGGILFFNNGEIIGGSYSWEKGELDGSVRNRDVLINKTKESGGLFNVRKIPTAERELKAKSGIISQEALTDVIDMLEGLLLIFERVIKQNKKIKTDLPTLLRKKFIDKTNEYDFLDPFADEFNYADGKISFVGEASGKDLVNGVVDSVRELANELGLFAKLKDELSAWLQKYAKELEKFEISV
jgi:hypothetical protein